ncbi:MAG: hypothetical protein AB1705_12820 [Verrucomicrobiota bacterium]
MIRSIVLVLRPPPRPRTTVAQVSNLLYRRFPIGRRLAHAVEQRETGRLETCDTAGWKPALRSLLALLCVPLLTGCLADRHASRSPEEKAVAFLSREVPAWHKENRCYSCHNNGDAVRALYVARQRGYVVPDNAIADTTAWLSRPAQWEHNKGDPAASDKRLARLQFAAALATAQQTGHVADTAALREAARLVAQDQEPDGAWLVGKDELVGSPTIYGRWLGTYMALETVRRAGLDELRPAAAKAERWVRAMPLNNVLQAGATLLTLRNSSDAEAQARRKAAVEFLLQAQGSSGGWGPFKSAPQEAFDTAVALLALQTARGEPAIADAIQRGRAYLLATQNDDGSWRETTRPPNGESYAQRISTTGWATLALLETGSGELKR